ncbi:MAG: transketolase C-terminal domain-containing protein, partial [Butyricicoccus sp.]
QSGSEVTIVTHGIMVNQAIDAAEILMHEGIRTQVYKVNEIGSGLEQAYAEVKEKLGGWCVVAEDVVPNGSVGEWLAAHRSERTDLLNTGDRFLPHGGVNELYRHCGIDAEGIAAYIMKNRNGKENGVG